MDIYYFLLRYLEIVNLISFALMGIDKYKARHDRRRIPERTLITTAVIGGSIGALGGMYLFHHKTRKPKFRTGLPLILAGQIALVLLLILVLSL